MPTMRETPSKSKKVGNAEDIILPSHANEAPSTLGEYTICIYGDKGIGKSTLASQFPDALTFMFEPQRSDVAIRQVPDYRRGEPLLTWDRYKKYLELVADDPKVKTVVIDNADHAYFACVKYVEEANGWSDIGEPAYGHGWRELRKEWGVTNNALRYLMASKPGGVIYTSHARRRETTSLSGQQNDWVVPTCDDKCWDYLKTCPIAIYYGWRERHRVLHLTGTEDLWAGIPDGRFRDRKTGKPLQCLLAGAGPAETYKILLEGFANCLENFDPNPEVTAAANAPVSLPKKGKK